MSLVGVGVGRGWEGRECEDEEDGREEEGGCAGIAERRGEERVSEGGCELGISLISFLFCGILLWGMRGDGRSLRIRFQEL